MTRWMKSTIPRPRGRPNRSAEQIAEMQTRIVERAYAMFLSEGFDAISMRRLASEVGCTVMTVYRYYPRKIDILRALWLRIFATMFDGLDQIAAATNDPAERLRRVAMGYVQFWLDRRDHYFLVFMSSNVEQADVSIFVQDDVLLARFDIFRASIAAALPRATPDSALVLKSELLISSLNGIAQNLITISGYHWSAPEQLVDAAVRGALLA
jgi:AcrR family transcriptional regulator